MYDVDLPKYLNATVIGPNGTRVTWTHFLEKEIMRELEVKIS